MTRHLLTPEDCADFLAVTPKIVRAWLRDGKLKGVRFGRLWRVHPDALDDFLADGFTNKPKTRQKPRKGSRSGIRAKGPTPSRGSRTGKKAAHSARKRTTKRKGKR